MNETKHSPLERGALVQYWFDDGRGGTVLYGRVFKAGLRTATVVWESGLRNRIRQGSHLVTLARDQEGARAALHKASPSTKEQA